MLSDRRHAYPTDSTFNGRLRAIATRPYTTSMLAGVLNTSEARVRSLVRAACITPDRNDRGQLRFSFQDLVRVKAVLVAACDGGSTRRIRRACIHIARQLEDGSPLSAVRIRVQGSRIVATARNISWTPESGQILFDFPSLPREPASAH